MARDQHEYRMEWKRNARKDPEYWEKEKEYARSGMRKIRAQRKAIRDYIAHLHYEWANGGRHEDS